MLQLAKPMHGIHIGYCPEGACGKLNLKSANAVRVCKCVMQMNGLNRQ